MAPTYTAFAALVYLFLTCSVLVNVTTALRCYICGGESKLPCKNFQNNDKFIKDCSPEEESCKTSKQGNQVLERSCEFNKLDDCSSVNKIRYCFCTHELCNGNSFPTDDEDLIEGSGKNIDKNDKFVLKVDISTPEKSSAFKLCFSSISIYLTFLLVIFFRN